MEQLGKSLDPFQGFLFLILQAQAIKEGGVKFTSRSLSGIFISYTQLDEVCTELSTRSLDPFQGFLFLIQEADRSHVCFFFVSLDPFQGFLFLIQI